MNPRYLFFFQQRTENIMNPFDIEEGVQFDPNTGQIVSGSENATDYIRINPSTSYKVMNALNAAVTVSAVVYYDIRKGFISASTSTSSISTPSNCYYIRVVFLNSSYATMGIFGSSVSVFEKWENGIAYPTYKDDLSFSIEKEGEQMFFRRKMSGNLTFIGADFSFIYSQTFETRFEMDMLISYDGGNTWKPYWKGLFYKTDCEFDLDNQNVKVSPNVLDEYTEILKNYEKEFDLVRMTPPVTQITYDRRLVLQIYVKGRDAISCFQRGSYWEQSATACDDHVTLNNDYGMARVKRVKVVVVTGSTIDEVNNMYYGDINNTDMAVTESYSFNGTDKEYDVTAYKFQMTKTQMQVQGAPYRYDFAIIRRSDNTVLYYYTVTKPNQEFYNPSVVTLSGDLGDVSATIVVEDTYARYLSDQPRIGSTDGHKLSASDMTYTLNYLYSYAASPSDVAGFVYFYRWFQETPTEWGKLGNWYYHRYDDYLPIVQSTWGELSIWFDPDFWVHLTQSFETAAARSVELQDCYKLSDALQIILSQFCPYLHAETQAYSKYLYYNYSQGIYPRTPVRLYITPKSNILHSGYDRAAQQAPITLKMIMDAMRDMFRCYWFVEDGMLKIEHIKYFMNGRSYSSPTEGRDLTEEIQPRVGKPWSFGTSKWKYDKAKMKSQYTFAWDDEVTRVFMGYPINVTSEYVEQGTKEEISVNKFTTDIDFMLANPSSCSDEGFALLGCMDNTTTVAYWPTSFSVQWRYQNYYLSFSYLQGNYAYDMPAYGCTVNGSYFGVYGIKKLKTQQVKIPAIEDLDLFKTINTSIGEGQIQSCELNLVSREAQVELVYASNQ